MNHVKRAHFTVPSKGRTVGVDFYADSAPFELVFSYQLVPPVLIPVLPGYRVPILLGEQYGPMRDVLGITAGGSTPWRPSDFFTTLNSAIPAEYVRRTHECRPEHAARYPGPEIEDADKTLYWYHRDWVQEGVVGERLKSLPTSKNLAKTRRLLGAEIADFCRRRHISICWTADRSDEKARHVDEIEKAVGFRE
ncbi:MAG: DUF6037 family protein [Gordonia sp. (in: high G+C Gram-positive bacteria)]|uniref:DUF6037 family protein n=1 Tax=Gordonia sp. (in: high G+C Gram-positive bacteria) TaxID=84139 RepID=UPI0039E6CCD7